MHPVLAVHRARHEVDKDVCLHTHGHTSVACSDDLPESRQGLVTVTDS